MRRRMSAAERSGSSRNHVSIWGANTATVEAPHSSELGNPGRVLALSAARREHTRRPRCGRPVGLRFLNVEPALHGLEIVVPHRLGMGWARLVILGLTAGTEALRVHLEHEAGVGDEMLAGRGVVLVWIATNLTPRRVHRGLPATASGRRSSARMRRRLTGRRGGPPR